MDRGLRHQVGFTLVEMIMTIVLLGVMAGLGSSMISDVYRSTRIVSAGEATSAQARYALERVARELREVQYVTNTNTYSITTPNPLAPSATTITFTRKIAGVDVQVTIALSGSNLTVTYSDTQVTSTLIGGVTAFTLDFLSVNDTATVAATTSAGSVRAIAVTLSVTDPTSGRTVSQATRVSLRNG
jgi:prepilin-type N-terminal cleavage/methylation domain-containing protein